MTKLWVNNAHTAVTLLEIVPQEVVRYKTSEKDGYEAAIIGVGKKELNKEKGHKVSYTVLQEFWCDDSFKSAFPAGTVVSSAAVTSFSPFTLASITAANPLPVKLISFDVSLTKNNVWLSWKTETEINNDFFTIERSSDYKNWEPIKKVTGAGNSNYTLSYSTVDQNPLEGISYYRLKQTDFNGEFSYSDIQVINNKEINEISVYPNPVKNTLYISNLCNDCIINVFSTSGQLIYNGSDTKIDTEYWKAGLYEVIIIDANGNKFQSRIIK